jgi:hypothetical protein
LVFESQGVTIQTTAGLHQFFSLLDADGVRWCWSLGSFIGGRVEKSGQLLGLCRVEFEIGHACPGVMLIGLEQKGRQSGAAFARRCFKEIFRGSVSLLSGGCDRRRSVMFQRVFTGFLCSLAACFSSFGDKLSFAPQKAGVDLLLLASAPCSNSACARDRCVLGSKSTEHPFVILA